MLLLHRLLCFVLCVVCVCGCVCGSRLNSAGRRTTTQPASQPHSSSQPVLYTGSTWLAALAAVMLPTFEQERLVIIVRLSQPWAHGGAYGFIGNGQWCPTTTTATNDSKMSVYCTNE